MTLNEAKEILLKQSLCENQCSLGCEVDCKECAFNTDITDMRYSTALYTVMEHYIKKYAKTHLSGVYGNTMKEGEDNDMD